MRNKMPIVCPSRYYNAMVSDFKELYQVHSLKLLAVAFDDASKSANKYLEALKKFLKGWHSTPYLGYRIPGGNANTKRLRKKQQKFFVKLRKLQSK